MTTNSNPEFEEFIEEEIWVETTTRTPRVAPPAPEHPSLVNLVETVINHGRTMVEAQIELVKLKAKASLTRAAGAVGVFVAAAVLVFYFIWWTFHTIEVGLTYAVPEWAASLITWGILLLLVIILVAVGVRLVNRAQSEAPDPKTEITDDIAAVKEGLGK